MCAVGGAVCQAGGYPGSVAQTTLCCDEGGAACRGVPWLAVGRSPAAAAEKAPAVGGARFTGTLSDCGLTRGWVAGHRRRQGSSVTRGWVAGLRRRQGSSVTRGWVAGLRRRQGSSVTRGWVAGQVRLLLGRGAGGAGGRGGGGRARAGTQTQARVHAHQHASSMGAFKFRRPIAVSASD